MAQTAGGSGLAVLPISPETMTKILVVAGDNNVATLKKDDMLLDHHLTDKADSGMFWINLV